MDEEVFKDQHMGRLIRFMDALQYLCSIFWLHQHAGSAFDIPLRVRLQPPGLQGYLGGPPVERSLPLVIFLCEFIRSV